MFLIIVGRLPFKLPYMFRFYVLVAIASALITHWYGKKKLNEWHIEEAYKLLSKKQRRVRNMLFFIVSWVVFYMFIYIGVINIQGYDKQFTENGTRITTKK